MPRNSRGSNYEVISMGGEFGIFILELGFQPPVMSHGESEIHFYGAIGHLSGNHFFLHTTCSLATPFPAMLLDS